MTHFQDRSSSIMKFKCSKVVKINILSAYVVALNLGGDSVLNSADS